MLEADLYLYNKDVINKYEYHSNIVGEYTKECDDWCATTNNGIIDSFKIGGSNCYRTYGIFYYDFDDGKKLGRDIEELYNDNKQIFYDQIPLNIYKDKYSISIRECQKGDIIEIDSLKELEELDSNYSKYNNEV